MLPWVCSVTDHRRRQKNFSISYLRSHSLNWEEFVLFVLSFCQEQQRNVQRYKATRTQPL